MTFCSVISSASSQRSQVLRRCLLTDLFWHLHPRKLPIDFIKESHTWGFRWHLANPKVGTCALRGENLIKGNRILGAGVFGYHSDCLPVSPYMSRTICITYVVYFKIKHCSGPAVPNSVSKNLWLLLKQHHIVILALSQSVLQCWTLKKKMLPEIPFCSVQTIGIGWLEKEKTPMLTLARGKQLRAKRWEH